MLRGFSRFHFRPLFENERSKANSCHRSPALKPACLRSSRPAPGDALKVVFLLSRRAVISTDSDGSRRAGDGGGVERSRECVLCDTDTRCSTQAAHVLPNAPCRNQTRCTGATDPTSLGATFFNGRS